MAMRRAPWPFFLVLILSGCLSNSGPADLPEGDGSFWYETDAGDVLIIEVRGEAQFYDVEGRVADGSMLQQKWPGSQYRTTQTYFDAEGFVQMTLRPCDTPDGPCDRLSADWYTKGHRPPFGLDLQDLENPEIQLGVRTTNATIQRHGNTITVAMPESFEHPGVLGPGTYEYAGPDERLPSSFSWGGATFVRASERAVVDKLPALHPANNRTDTRVVGTYLPGDSAALYSLGPSVAQLIDMAANESSSLQAHLSAGCLTRFEATAPSHTELPLNRTELRFFLETYDDTARTWSVHYTKSVLGIESVTSVEGEAGNGPPCPPHPFNEGMINPFEIAEQAWRIAGARNTAINVRLEADQYTGTAEGDAALRASILWNPEEPVQSAGGAQLFRPYIIWLDVAGGDIIRLEIPPQTFPQIVALT